MNRPEQQFHITVAAFLDQIPGLMWFHTPNASGNRGPRLGGILKAMGVKPGVPDILIILPGGKVAFLELKAGKGSLSPAQRAFRDDCLERGCLWESAKTLDEVGQIVNRWLSPFGYRVPRVA